MTVPITKSKLELTTEVNALMEQKVQEVVKKYTGLPASKDILSQLNKELEIVFELNNTLSNAPWYGEPDLHIFMYRGYDAEIRRSALGFLCGYVIIKSPKNKILTKELINKLNVHGGIMYKEAMNPEDQNSPIRIGFDCGHSCDYYPTVAFTKEESSYKTVSFVKYELEKLIDQLIIEFEEIKSIKFKPKTRLKFLK